MYEVNANLVNIARDIDWCLARGKLTRSSTTIEEMKEVKRSALVVIRFLYPDHPILDES